MYTYGLLVRNKHITLFLDLINPGLSNMTLPLQHAQLTHVNFIIWGPLVDDSLPHDFPVILVNSGIT